MSASISSGDIHPGDLVWLVSGDGPFTVVVIYERALLIQPNGHRETSLRGIHMSQVVRVEKPITGAEA